MTVLNDLDRFHLVMDAIDRLPQTGDKGVYLKQQLKDKLIEHKQYMTRCAVPVTYLQFSVLARMR
jgi:xylulose-5-phosphate/fructose-6-phosphate phosphoketolase